MNNKFGISDKSFILLEGVFRKFPEVERTVIFGSRAKGNYKPGSDIDLAIFGSKCTPILALNLQGYLNEEIPTPYYIDVIDYQSLNNADLKDHIKRVGKVFYEKQK